MPTKVTTEMTCFRCGAVHLWNGSRENAVPQGWIKFDLIHSAYTTVDILCGNCLAALNRFLLNVSDTEETEEQPSGD